jgi:bis(5'-nucleosidyl)-tetraphosphatase
MGTGNDTTEPFAGQGRGGAAGAGTDPVRGDEVKAAGFILWRAGADRTPRFLLLETRKGGHWSPPKGHLETGEGDLDAARRETLEECGIVPIVVDATFREEIGYPVVKKGKHRQKRVIYFLGEAGPGEVRLSDEHTSARWVTPVEAWAMIPFPTLSGVIERAAFRVVEIERARAAPTSGGNA